ncbi:TetR/AcrR family transcriptional regulator [Paenibacillus sp. GCM10023248]|uniref:TetR/AcrR family transcriptional regulator n=1 Tax=Bacillales TaxID=1385 RepID=UPI002379D4E3|nr:MULTISPECIES: TetR/AcrR family transcriptional regulator [Bacillales]MDD9268842.1 TetR/AcrR family transcriptional regulator [Paenibacillus sp. MAHUQ-63]MDR6882079.1 AcrR family transcriptional regulator [Bacillus sp. 3255]
MNMNGFEKRAQQKKEIIMNTTFRMLQSTDPKKLRIADIAEEAGVSQVTIYNYYGSKEALVREVFIDYIRQTITEFEQFMAGSHTLKEKMEYIVFQKKKSSRTFGLEIMKHIWREDPELSRFVREEYMARGMPLVVQLIEEGKKNGEITDKLSTSTIIMYMQMLTNQADMMLEHAELHGDLDGLIEEMVHLFFYGIGTVPGPQDV